MCACNVHVVDYILLLSHYIKHSPVGLKRPEIAMEGAVM